MKYKIVIEWVQQPSLMRVALMRRFMWLWCIEVWIVESVKECNPDTAFDWICEFVDSYKVTLENIFDYTKNVEV